MKIKLTDVLLFTKRRLLILIMRTFIFLLCTSMFSLTPSYVLSQNAKISIEEDKTVTVDEVFKIIREQTDDYMFIYPENLFKDFPKVQLKKGVIKLSKLLEESLSGGNVNVTVTANNTILIKKKSTADRQQRQVSGKVTDEKGFPLGGASVIIKGAQKGALTNFDGEFTLEVGDNAVLLISYMGYITKEVVVSGNTINVQLKENTTNLDEVLLIGYGSQKRADVTGAIGSYKLKENDGVQFSSAANLLQGRVAGVVVSTGTSQPGAAASIRIRGTNSLRNDNEPLYVVDNIPLQSSSMVEGGPFEGFSSGNITAQSALASINPSDIERIEVLKDASATAIYGSRGANGVILITTKKGSVGELKVGFETSMTATSIAKKYDVMDLDTYVQFRNEGVTPGNERFLPSGSFPSLQSGGYVYIPDLVEYDSSNPNTYRALEEKDWQQELYAKQNISKNYRVTLSGGTESLKYFISGGYRDLSGMVKGTGLSQMDFRTNLSGKLNKKLRIGLTLNAVRRNNSMMQNSQSTYNGAVREALKGKPYVYAGAFDNEEYADLLEDEQITSVYVMQNEYKDKGEEYGFNGGMNLTYDIAKNFSYEMRSGGGYKWKERRIWYSPNHPVGSNFNGLLGITTLKLYNFSMENLLRYRKSFNKNFDLDVLGGYTYNNSNVVNDRVNGRDYEIISLGVNGLHLAGAVSKITPRQSDFTLKSYLGRANIRLFGGKYIFTGSIRKDGSSKFPNDKWGTFSSGAFAWSLNKENFLKDSKFVDQLKLRVGWGQTGNQGISPFSTVADYSSVNGHTGDNDATQIALQINNIANPNLSWETSESTNLGLNFSVLNSRLSGSVDAYTKSSSNLLNNRSLPASSGFGSFQLNEGSIENKGFEIELSGTPISTDDFNLTIGGNFSFNRTKIIDIGLEPSSFGRETYAAFFGGFITQGGWLGVPGNIFIEGRAPGLFWGYETDGVILDEHMTDDGVPVDYTVGVNEGGQLKYVDQPDENGVKDGVINADDKTILGDPNPGFTYAFDFDLTYKSFGLRTVFNGVQDIDRINVGVRDLSFPGASTSTFNTTTASYENAWRENSPSNEYVKVGAELPLDLTSFAIEDASYLRLSELTFSYNLPVDVLKKIGLSNMSLYLTGTNLLTITNYTGYNPEVNSIAFNQLRMGIDYNNSPSFRSYTLGARITF